MERSDYCNDTQMVLGGMTRVPELKPLSQINFCNETHECGHACRGCHGEKKCLPCLEPGCREAEQLTKDDTCIICKASALDD